MTRAHRASPCARRGRGGFTLIEVMVALAIVAIALLAGMQAISALTRNAARETDVLLAHICAENELVKVRLSGQMPSIGDGRTTCEQAGRSYGVLVMVLPAAQSAVPAGGCPGVRRRELGAARFHHRGQVLRCDTPLSGYAASPRSRLAAQDGQGTPPWPGEARSTASAGMACSAAIGPADAAPAACRGRSTQHLASTSAPRGFTLIELMVAIAVMALIAIMSCGAWTAWCGRRSRPASAPTPAGDADGAGAVEDRPGRAAGHRGHRAARLGRPGAAHHAPRHAPARRRRAGGGLDAARRGRRHAVAALAVGPLRTRGEWNEAWQHAAQWARTPSEADRRSETVLMPLLQWQLFYFRRGLVQRAVQRRHGRGAAGAGGLTPEAASVPDGISLHLMLPPGGALAGAMTIDWVNPLQGATSHDEGRRHQEAGRCAQPAGGRGTAGRHAHGDAGGQLRRRRDVAAVARGGGRNGRARPHPGGVDPDRRAGLVAADPARRLAGARRRRHRQPDRALGRAAGGSAPLHLPFGTARREPGGRRQHRHGQCLSLGPDHRHAVAPEPAQPGRQRPGEPGGAAAVHPLFQYLGLPMQELDLLARGMVRAQCCTARPAPRARTTRRARAPGRPAAAAPMPATTGTPARSAQPLR